MGVDDPSERTDGRVIDFPLPIVPQVILAFIVRIPRGAASGQVHHHLPSQICHPKAFSVKGLSVNWRSLRGVVSDKSVACCSLMQTSI